MGQPGPGMGGEPSAGCSTDPDEGEKTLEHDRLRSGLGYLESLDIQHRRLRKGIA